MSQTIESLQQELAETDARIQSRAERKLLLEREIAWLRGYIAGRADHDLETAKNEEEQK